MINVILMIVGVLAVGILWVMIYDTTHFETVEYTVADPKIRKEFRAVVLADLHNKKFGRDNELLLEAVRAGKPDLVLVAGDLLTAKPGENPEPALALVRELAKEYPICYGVGNHEHRMNLYPEHYGDLGERYEAGLKEADVYLMHNVHRVLEEYGVCVTGSEIHKRFYKRFRKCPMEPEYMKELLGAPAKEYYNVLLAHNPAYFKEYAEWGADLVLSGHVHGGVVRIPFWNRGVLSPSIQFFPEYDGGLFQEKDSTMLLSRGLGSHTIPFRLFNPGELIFLQFTPGEKGKVERAGRAPLH